MIKNFKLQQKRKSKGQVLIMYALMMLVLVAIIGLAIDVGYLYVSYARLRRAVDAAALDASNQIKEGYTGVDLERAAEQFLQLNDVNDPTATVRFCNPDAGFEAWHDPSMCTEPYNRKLVSVRASSRVPMFFMAAIGFDDITISASAESEAASVDVILVIDISASQVNEGGTDKSGARRDPYWCNNVNLGTPMEGGCLPFENVKDAAMTFVENGVYLKYDRVGIVTFSRFAERYLDLTNDEELIKKKIRELKVDELEPCNYFGDEEVTMADGKSMCRHYKVNSTVEPSIDNELFWDDLYLGQDCPQSALRDKALDEGDTDLANDYKFLMPDCNNTNSGAGLLAATEMFLDKDPMLFRDESTWVVIFLTDGGANIGYKETIYSSNDDLTEYCPEANILGIKACRDGDPNVRHPTTQPLLYDPDDYARDAMDNLFGNQVYVFTIGQGPLVTNSIEATGIIEYAEGHESGNGASYFGSGEAQLREIFLLIANRISTRLTR